MLATSNNSRFSHLAKSTARITGRPAAFGIAAAIVPIWVFTGPLFDFSDAWQLGINTGTTIVRFLMGFLIQHAQNVDSEAMQAKLDELTLAIDGAHNALLDLEPPRNNKLEESAIFGSKDILENRHEMGDAAGQDEQVPDAMGVGQTGVESVEENADGVENPARCKPGEASPPQGFQQRH